MIQESPSKVWIPVTAAIITGACAVIAAIVTLGTPFAERMADRYYPPFTPTPNLIPPADAINSASVSENPTSTAIAVEISSPKLMVNEKDSMVLLPVPSGNFVMGSYSNQDEQPVHPVQLSSFWIDQTEVTNKQYAICVAAGACNPPLQINSYTHDWYYGNPNFDNYPVVYVTWDNAKTYCQWAGRDLPTEAQWEKAASWNDSNQQSYIYPWGDNFNGSVVNFCDSNCLIDHADKKSNDGYSDTSPVMNYPNGVSPYGIYDMAGNVWEWVNDWYDATYYSYSPPFEPLGADSGTYRVLRGDSWWGYSYGVRSADRNPFLPSKSANNIGFRCASSNP